MKTIALTHGQLALVDDEDFEKFGHLSWAAQYNKSNNSYYAFRTFDINKKRFKQYLHREIMAARKGQDVDHKDYNTLNCQKYNLRICSHAQNMYNRSGPNKNSTSGIRGVHWNKEKRKWQAQIKVDGKHMFLGYFQDKIMAYAASVKARAYYFGEFQGAYVASH